MLSRRLVLLLPGLAVLARSQERLTATEVLSALEPLTSALSAESFLGQNAMDFARAATNDFARGLTREFPDRQNLLSAVSALLSVAAVNSSVTIVEIKEGQATVDWVIDLRFRSPKRVSQRRREVLTVEVQNGKVSRLTPVSFFRLPELQ